MAQIHVETLRSLAEALASSTCISFGSIQVTIFSIDGGLDPSFAAYLAPFFTVSFLSSFLYFSFDD
jgi:hypothetical protein